MVKRILVDAVHPEETRVVIQRNEKIEEFDYETSLKRQLKGNIYLAKVTRVEPSLQAAFVDYGGEKHGFLPFSEIHPDYYQIPVSDRERLVEQIHAESSHDDEDVESSDSEDDEYSFQADDEFQQSGQSSLYRKYKIQEVIKRNQLIQVQVIKEERGNKGASLTSYISLAGRYCVLMPFHTRQGGVSRRIADAEDRKRLRDIIREVASDAGMGFIVRTAGAGQSKAAIKRDYQYLKHLWDSIREATVSSTAPAFIHTEGDIVKRFLRDYYNDSISEILIEGDDAYKHVREFIKITSPKEVSKVKRYRSKTPLFVKFNAEEQISRLYDSVANLESGGYLVLNPTEALVSIDVNSGKSTSQRNVEQTALQTNLEAAEEIARQLRLRDLSGLIVIDFIDMMDGRNRRAVERALRDALRYDRARIQVGRISSFGLMEMSRQRLRSSLMEANTIACPGCKGLGTVRAPGSIAIVLLRAIGQAVHKGGYKEISVHATSDVVNYMLNYKRDDIVVLEGRYGVRIFMHSDEILAADDFRIERRRQLSAGIAEPEPVLQNLSVEFDEEDGEAANDSSSSRKSRNHEQADAASGDPVTSSRSRSAGARGRRRTRKSGGGRGMDTESLLQGLWKRIIE